MSKINNILSKIKTAKENQKTELESQMIKLNADTLLNKAKGLLSESQRNNNKTKSLRDESVQVVTALKTLKKQIDSLQSLSDKTFDEANDIFAEAEKKYFSLTRIKSDMKTADLDTSSVDKEMKSYSEVLGYASEALELSDETTSLLRDSESAIKSI